MKKEEKDLILKLSCVNKRGKDRLEELTSKYATPAVLGNLFFNRMSGVAYSVLKEEGLLGYVSREFRNSLRDSYEYNILKNEDFFKAVEYLSNILKDLNGKYAALKGALLCSLYPKGLRTSNDIDLLVRPEDISEIGKTLLDAGFRQGYVRNSSFIPASRKEIIESKMTRGETVPYILQTNYQFLKFLEVDINFSLDYKNSNDDSVDSMIRRGVRADCGGYSVNTLDKYDFFIHLCLHLYKEASTLPWIKMKRDMTLYKFCDISATLDSFHLDKEKLFKRARKLEADKIVACVILWTSGLFPLEDEDILSESRNILLFDADIMDVVFSPAEKKQYKYLEKDIRRRFFSENREGLLMVKKYDR